MTVSLTPHNTSLKAFGVLRPPSKCGGGVESEHGMTEPVWRLEFKDFSEELARCNDTRSKYGSCCYGLCSPSGVRSRRAGFGLGANRSEPVGCGRAPLPAMCGLSGDRPKGLGRDSWWDSGLPSPPATRLLAPRTATLSMQRLWTSFSSDPSSRGLPGLVAR